MKFSKRRCVPEVVQSNLEFCKIAIICSCCRTKSEFGISGSGAARSMAKKLQIVVLGVRFVTRRARRYSELADRSPPGVCAMVT
jgi:hypothetical protein